MFLKICTFSSGVFKREYRKQLFASLCATTITFCHGIALGWISPMLAKLQSQDDTPLNFSINLEESSWLGALVCFGGLVGNVTFGILIDRIGRKTCLYCLAVPHLCFWSLVYFAHSIKFLYVARVCAGITGGGSYVVIPIFIGEIADSSIRGRLTSLFVLTLNTGILGGFILSSHLSYHLIPCAVLALPIFYLGFLTYFPETPQHLLRSNCQEDMAKESFRFYRNYTQMESMTKIELEQLNSQFDDLKLAVMEQKSQNNDANIGDFFTKRSLKALCTGIVLMLLNIFSGSFALINYTSSVFAATKATLYADTNTIIIGAVQILGTYIATLLVDGFGRKILLIISTAGMGIGLAAFGMYAFFAEETTTDLSNYSWWLPLLLVSLIILLANMGLLSVSIVALVEIMPAKIRSRAASLCFVCLSGFAFLLLKVFPIFMHVFGLSATMWFCASVCAFGLFYISIFLEETKGKSMDKDNVE